jgi:hypothetical protein
MTSDNQGPTEFQKFQAGLKKIVSVPKSEILKREAEYKAARKRRKKPPVG